MIEWGSILIVPSARLVNLFPYGDGGIHPTVSGKARDLYGSAPDKHDTALLIIDMINDMQFPEAPMLLQFAIPMAGRIKALAARARVAGVPVIFVNDNFGRWRSDFKALVRHCLHSPGKKLARLLMPKAKDYFVLKPKHSAFHSTTLDLLLKHLGTRRLILTGMAEHLRSLHGQ